MIDSRRRFTGKEKNTVTELFAHINQRADVHEELEGGYDTATTQRRNWIEQTKTANVDWPTMKTAIRESTLNTSYQLYVSLHSSSLARTLLPVNRKRARQEFTGLTCWSCYHLALIPLVTSNSDTDWRYWVHFVSSHADEGEWLFLQMKSRKEKSKNELGKGHSVIY